MLLVYGDIRSTSLKLGVDIEVRRPGIEVPVAVTVLRGVDPVFRGVLPTPVVRGTRFVEGFTIKFPKLFVNE